MFSFVIFCIGFLQKFVHNSSKVFFGGIKSNIFRKIFDDESSDNAFRWQNYLRTMLNRFSYFKIKSKLTFMYFFIIISDISAIRSDLSSVFAITFYMMMLTMMNTADFLIESSSNSSFSVSARRKPSENIIYLTTFKIAHLIWDLVDKGNSFIEDYELAVNSYDFCCGGFELIMGGHRYR